MRPEMSPGGRNEDPVELVMYTRAGCHLCDEMERAVLVTLEPESYVLRKVDVDSQRALQDRYGMILPVLAIGGVDAFETRLVPAELRERVQSFRKVEP